MTRITKDAYLLKMTERETKVDMGDAMAIPETQDTGDEGYGNLTMASEPAQDIRQKTSTAIQFLNRSCPANDTMWHTQNDMADISWHGLHPWSWRNNDKIEGCRSVICTFRFRGVSVR